MQTLPFLPPPFSALSRALQSANAQQLCIARAVSAPLPTAGDGTQLDTPRRKEQLAHTF